MEWKEYFIYWYFKFSTSQYSFITLTQSNRIAWSLNSISKHLQNFQQLSVFEAYLKNGVSESLHRSTNAGSESNTDNRCWLIACFGSHKSLGARGMPSYEQCKYMQNYAFLLPLFLVLLNYNFLNFILFLARV